MLNLPAGWQVRSNTKLLTMVHKGLPPQSLSTLFSTLFSTPTTHQLSLVNLSKLGHLSYLRKILFLYKKRII